MGESKPLILVVEDDLDVADMLDAYFSVQGYAVAVANLGEDAILQCKKVLPNLVILDIRLPDIDGFEVARQLRTNRRTKDIPILFLTEKRARADRLHGLELGADDYITKPFDVQELRLRVRNALRRTDQGSLTNPVTGLPEGALVDERLKECIGKADWAILVVSLNHLDDFREAYGFVASDDVLRALSLMIHNAVRDLGGANDFSGQLGPHEFILVTGQSRANSLRERLSTRLEQSLDYFYPLKDRSPEVDQSNHLTVAIRQLTPDQGPFLELSALKTRLLKQH